MQQIESIYASLANGEAWRAEAMAREGLAASSNSSPWLCALGHSLAQQARSQEAEEVFRKLAALQPEEAAHWSNIGNACLHQGLAMQAQSAFERAQRLGAAGVEFDLGYGLALLAAGRHAVAVKRLRRAHAADPAAADTCIAYATSLCELEQHEEALAVIDGMRTHETATRRESEMLAWILAQAGRDGDAERALRGLIDAAPFEATPRIQLALLLERLNRIAEAQCQLQDSAVQRSPPTIALGLASARILRRRGDHANALLALERSGTCASDDAGHAALAFERARILDANSEPSQAMDALAHAHAYAGRALRARFPESAEAHELAWLNERLQHHAPPSWNVPITDGLPADPAFLVGFPRSGTTLLETVLDSHPDIVALDERPALERAIECLRSSVPNALDTFAAPSVQARSRSRGVYWREVARYRPITGRERLLDKYPLHLSRIPYIARLFPDARVLLLLRHPCDCVLSCYMQNFGMKGGVLSFATLAATAETYARIMGYWDEQRLRVDTPVHTLRYEDLVGDFQGQTTRALEFLGLGWNPAVTAYRDAASQRTDRVRTPSYAQVAAPISRGAVDRWHRYRDHFSDKALNVLAPFVERYGYTLD